MYTMFWLEPKALALEEHMIAIRKLYPQRNKNKIEGIILEIYQPGSQQLR